MDSRPSSADWDPQAWFHHLRQARLCLRQWQEIADMICGPERLPPTIPVACRDAEVWRRRALRHLAVLRGLAEVAPDPDNAQAVVASFWKPLERRCSHW